MKSYREEVEPAKIISARRTELALTQADLARKLGYPNVSFISMLEKGSATGGSKVPLEKGKVIEIAEALEIDPKWFIERVMRQRYPEVANVLFPDAKKGSKAA